MEQKYRPLIVALAGALGAALLTIAFLIGRLTAPPAATTAAAPMPWIPPVTSASPLAEASSEPITTTSLPAASVGEGLIPATAGVAPPSRLDIPLPPTIGASTPPSSTSSPEASKIAAYFQQVDGMQDMGVGDPQTFAASLLKSVSSGDFSAFDELLGKARAQRQRLQAIAPPQACGEHHRLALTLSADSVTMLERLKAALMKGDSMALMTIATEGRVLETQASQLKNLGETIRRQAGL
jgi:hypothetical protein